MNLMKFSELDMSKMFRWLVTAAPALLLAGAAQAGNYVLEIGGRTVELDLDTPASVSLDGGKPVAVMLRQKTEQVWRSDDLSFSYPTAVRPTRHVINADAVQIMLPTASGTVIIIQRYSRSDPALIIDQMVATLTDDHVRAGYRRTSRPATRALAGGLTLTGQQVHTERADDQSNLEIVTLRAQSGGYLIATVTDPDAPPADARMVEQFWRTLRLNTAPSH